MTAGCLLCIAVATPLAGAGEILRSDDIVRQMKPKPRTRGIAAEPAGPSTDRVVLPAIQFELDSAKFTPAALAQVKELGKAIRSNALSPFSFAVLGHTDSTGSSAYNRRLSSRRARAVTRYLADEMGLPAGRLTEVGLGESFPVDGIPTTDPRNRRVEISKLGSGLPAEDRTPKRRRALLIGIDKYQNVSPLNGPVNDAKEMANFITGSGSFQGADIQLLLDAEATKKNILAAVEKWLIEGTGPGDEAFLFYSGHGFQQPDMDGDEADRLDETLVPVDAFVDGGGNVKRMITDDELGVLLARLSGRRVRIVVDACHSGTSTRSAGGVESWRYVKTPRLPDGSPIRVVGPRTRGVAGRGEPRREVLLAPNDPDFTIWTAVRADQKALVDREAADRAGGGSVYTRRWLWGARDGKADLDRDGVVTIAELQRYLLEESEAYCKRHSDDCRLGLTPQVQVASGELEVPAFEHTSGGLSRNATLAKDILVRASVGPAPTSGVRLRIEPGSKLTVGADLDIIVESDRKGDLVVLDINAAGELVQIFPNEHSLRGGVPSWIGAGQPVTLPGEKAGFRFKATPPVGSGLLVAIVAQENDRLGELASRHKDLAVVPSPAAYLVEIGETLRPGSPSVNPGRSGWNIATLEYEIVSPDAGSKQ